MVFSTFVSIENYLPDWSNNSGGPIIQNSSTSSKARITYLNLPTQIFDPANIKIKAKAVHGN